MIRKSSSWWPGKYTEFKNYEVCLLGSQPTLEAPLSIQESAGFDHTVVIMTYIVKRVPIGPYDVIDI